MSVENAIKFFIHVEQDPICAEKIERTTNREEIVAIARFHGYQVSERDFAMVSAMMVFRSQELLEDELSDAELDVVVGGTNTYSMFNRLTVVIQQQLTSNSSAKSYYLIKAIDMFTAE